MQDKVNGTDTPILLGCDHAAVFLKEKIKEFLLSAGQRVEDVGTTGSASVDYPDFAVKVASEISSNPERRGILLCGTGLGMSMVANKYSGVRAALCTEPFSARMSRRHNNANILVLGGRITGEELAYEIVDVWLKTPFDGGRHQLRLDKFNALGKAGTNHE